jgi:hypothetical protein
MLVEELIAEASRPPHSRRSSISAPVETGGIPVRLATGSNAAVAEV